MKNILSILSPIILIFLVVSGTYYYLTADSENFKLQNETYISLINDNHNFEDGLTNLKTLTTEKAKETLKNIDKEIELATILNDVNSSLQNANVDDAYNKIENAKKIDTLKIFTPAISFLDINIQNFNKAADEISKLDKNDAELGEKIKNIVNSYHFDYITLREKLLNTDFIDDTSTQSNNNSDSTTPFENNYSNNSSTNNVRNTTTSKNDTSKSKKQNSIPNSSFHPQINGQQAPETYNTIRYTQEGATSRAIIENELKGDISNFTNEQIDEAITAYNNKTKNN